jgi:hypothetical protein
MGQPLLVMVPKLVVSGSLGVVSENNSGAKAVKAHMHAIET